MSREVITRIIIVMCCILFFSFKAGDIKLQFTGDENFYFQSSKNMVEKDEWLTPRYYGKPRFQKPILYYWLVAASFKIFGINWFGARFPSILLASFIVLLTYLISQTLVKKRSISILSALILMTTFKFFRYARFAIPDMTLLFFITLSLYLFLKILENNSRILRMAFFISLALAVLTKGPIGVVVPILSIAAFLYFSKERIVICKADILLGILLSVAIIFPWFLIMSKVHGLKFVSEVWTREIMHRVIYHSDTKEGISVFIEYLKSLFFYIPILIVRFLPWSLFLPKGIINSFSVIFSTRKNRSHILILCWFFTVFIFFSLMGEKHSQYILALTPPFALLVGVGFSHALEFKRRSLALPVVLLFFTASIFLFFLANKEFRLNNAILSEFASKMVSYGLAEGDRIGSGSHSLIPQQLEVYLDRPVEKLGGKWYDPDYHERTNKIQLENFFKAKDGVFCVIKREDFEKYLSSTLKKRLKIIHKDFLWKRRIRITKNSLSLLFRGDITAFLNGFKEEYYLVTDK